MDWVVGTGKTQSGNTGPTADHTYGNTTGENVVYLDGLLDVACPHNRATLDSQLTTPMATRQVRMLFI